ncbi:MAG: dTDP-4-dehydrorhamnose reductase [Rhodobacter sp.]|nr:dTDP-4-dehydrorhamnose reductase [Rhodobacter sp.]
MRALIFGTTGQVAAELRRRAPAGADVTALGRDKADLTRPAACAAAIAGHGADLVINAAAYTAVDKAEEEEPLATVINADAPAAMARAAAELGVPFCHVSTDYVFDGSGDAPWRTGDPTAPLGAYGRSKLAGECGVLRAGGTHAILRTSWVFSALGSNFVKTMLRLAETRSRLTVVADQVGGPTAAADIADALWTIGTGLMDGAKGGTYHFSGAPDVSWADFAREIFAQAGRAVEVVDIPGSGFPSPARRPSNSRLDCTELETEFGLKRPDWRQSLAEVLADLKEAAV